MTAPSISRPCPVEDQQAFFHDEHRIISPAATRNIVGRFFEACTAQMLGATPHAIDGRCEINPDLSLPGGLYLECKSIGRGRQGLIYSQRRENDRRLVATGARLVYVFWIHNVEATAFSTVEALHAALAVGIERVLVVPFERVDEACRSLVPRVMNYRAGRAGGTTPMAGYRLSWSTLERISTGKAVVRRKVGTVCRVEVPPVELHGPDLAAVLPPLTDSEQRQAAEMLAELSTSSHRVVSVPAPDPRYPGHKIRQVESTNPEWYRALCAAHVRPERKQKHQLWGPDTDIRRHLVEQSLDRLSRGICRYPYDWMLRPLVESTAVPF